MPHGKQCRTDHVQEPVSMAGLIDTLEGKGEGEFEEELEQLSRHLSRGWSAGRLWVGGQWDMQEELPYWRGGVCRAIGERWASLKWERSMAFLNCGPGLVWGGGCC